MRRSWFKKKHEKNKVYNLLILSLLLILCLLLLYIPWKKREGLRFLKQIGNGINLGNTLDATNLRDFKPDADELDYETFWGIPKLHVNSLRLSERLGFKPCVFQLPLKII